MYTIQKTYPTEPDLQPDTVETETFPDAGIIPLDVLAGPVSDIIESAKKNK